MGDFGKSTTDREREEERYDIVPLWMKKVPIKERGHQKCDKGKRDERELRKEQCLAGARCRSYYERVAGVKANSLTDWGIVWILSGGSKSGKVKSSMVLNRELGY